MLGEDTALSSTGVTRLGPVSVGTNLKRVRNGGMKEGRQSIVSKIPPGFMYSIDDIYIAYTINTTAILKLVDEAQPLNAGDTSLVVCLNQRAIEQHSPHHLWIPNRKVLRSFQQYRQKRPCIVRIEFCTQFCTRVFHRRSPLSSLCS